MTSPDIHPVDYMQKLLENLAQATGRTVDYKSLDAMRRHLDEIVDVLSPAPKNG